MKRILCLSNCNDHDERLLDCLQGDLKGAPLSKHKHLFGIGMLADLRCQNIPNPKLTGCFQPFLICFHFIHIIKSIINLKR